MAADRLSFGATLPLVVCNDCNENEEAIEEVDEVGKVDEVDEVDNSETLWWGWFRARTGMFW